MSVKESVVTHTLPDDLCSKTGITLKWVDGDTISVNGYNHITSLTKDKPTKFTNTNNVNIFHLQKEFIFHEPILRSLLAESNSIFLTVQKMKQNDNKSDYLKISRTYRSIIRACIEKLQNLAVNEQGEEQIYQSYITIFYSIECVWHLCEILLIDPTPSNVIVSQLLEWIRFHFPKYEKLALEYLQFEREANSNSEYWNCIQGLIIQGNIHMARTLLRLHPGVETMSFQMADQILKMMPIYNAYGGLSLQKFKSQWQYWVADTESKLSAGLLVSEPELEQIIKLTTGNTSVWSELIKSSNGEQDSCWYEYFPGFLFYTEPGCKHFELGTFANSWLNRWSKTNDINFSNGLKYLDKVILSVIENDMNQVLHDIQQICDNQWFVTHLTDLLYHCGQLEIVGEHQDDVTLQLRESFLFEFGSMLMSRESLWMFGIDYLQHCSIEGIGAMEIFLSKIPIKNEKHALKIITLAHIKGLSNIEIGICRVMVTRSMTNKRYGNALEWALRSQDYTLVTSIADIFLYNYCENGEMLCHDILTNIGPKMLISPRLVFLVKYFDFRQLFKQRLFEAAAELLINMLDSHLTPDYFWHIVLADTIPLLENENLIIPSKGTYVIIHYLELKLIPLIEKYKKQHDNFTSPDDNDFDLNKTTSLNFFNHPRIKNDELIKLIRLACASNLARALIIEKTSVTSFEIDF